VLKCRSTISKLLFVLGASFALATAAAVERAQALGRLAVARRGHSSYDEG